MLHVPQPAQSVLRVRRERAVLPPISCKAVGNKSQRESPAVRPWAPPLALLGQTQAGRVLLGRTYPRIGQIESKIVESGKVTVTNGATKFAISITTTTLATSGRRTLVGQHLLSRARSRGPIGDRLEVGADTPAIRRPTATGTIFITPMDRSITE